MRRVVKEIDAASTFCTSTAIRDTIGTSGLKLETEFSNRSMPAKVMIPGLNKRISTFCGSDEAWKWKDYVDEALGTSPDLRAYKIVNRSDR